MTTLETRVYVPENRKITLQLPDEVGIGEWDIKVTIQKKRKSERRRILKDVQEAQREFEAGNFEITSPEDLLRDALK